MKLLTLGLVTVSAMAFSHTELSAEEAGQKEKPKYISEAPLPKGWPQPGPYNQVSEKRYPAYRAAFTNGKGSSFAFWRLFRHIKRQEIPMTSPVEMGMEQKDDKRLGKTSMAFLYQGQDVGKTGPDGAKITVKDVAATRALSYAWQGDDSKANIAKAKQSLFEELKKRKLEHASIRLLGYNGPGVPRDKKTWELQAIIKEIK